MKIASIASFIIIFFTILYATNSMGDKMTKINPNLSSEEKKVIVYKGTEMPFSGEFYKHKENGIYVCKNCGADLFDSQAKFESGSGWPSFDDSIKNAVKEIPDKDGRRIEIVCANCEAHLGHVFRGEYMTQKNTRHCVNSLSLDFKKIDKNNDVEYAYFAGGCFWGVEYHFEHKKGVLEAISGYMGGKIKDPTYHDVCYRNTGHLEVVKVAYNPKEVSYEELAKLFFEIHDPTQKNGQGPDIGEQYLSAVFVNNKEEEQIIKKLISQLEKNKYFATTKILDAKSNEFYKAEEYHQNYYEKHSKVPYCHTYTKRF